MPDLTPERWQRIDDLFNRAADLPAAERAAFLDREAAGDPDLRSTVEEMLAGLTGDMIAPVIEEAIKEFRPPDVFAGMRMGAYELVESIGKGGMGTVYRATRKTAEFEQQVAVKVLHPGIAGGRLANRFYAERRILSSLEHPYIARLIDGGTHEGLPYLVMEFADGVPVTQYCRDRGLDVRQRLELFRKICQAVQHAHQRLVVHADLKPSNILVLADGTPKLLDFGVAKLLDPDGVEGEPLTDTGWRPMTPEFASPEQIRGEQITVAADVYALGVILCQLLTGSRPYQLKNHTPAELEQIVGTSPVPVPSSLVREDTRLQRELRGDLDTILLMALRKEPERRYASVEQFSEDIRRYLAGQTVTARPDTATYRLEKFVRRHRVAVVLGVALLVTAGAGVFFTIREGRRAQNRFRQVRSLAMKVLTDFDAEARKLAASETLRRKMVDESLLYLDSLAAESGGDPALEQELALAYHRIADIQGYQRIPNLGRRDLAVQYHRKGLEIEERLRARHGDNVELLRSMALGYSRLSDIYARTGKGKDAEEMLAKAVALATPDDPGTYVPARLQMSRRHFLKGEMGEALRYLDEVIGPAERLPDPAYLVVALYERAEILQLSGRVEESIEEVKRGLAVIERNRAKVAGDVMFVRRESFLLNQWGLSLAGLGVPSLGKWCDAAEKAEKALAIRPPDPRDAPVLAGMSLTLLEAKAMCGQRLEPALLEKVRGYLGGHAEGGSEMELSLGLEDWKQGRRAAARKRLTAVGENGAGSARSWAWEALAEMAREDGAREESFSCLRKAREARAEAVREPSPNLLARRFEQGVNLAKAIEWGDPAPGLRDELRKMVALWPAGRLAEELEHARRVAAR